MAHKEDFLKLANAAREHVCEISPQEARDKQAAGAHLIDVRDSEELLDIPPLPRAVNISRGRLEIKIGDVVADKDAPLVLYCAGGNRGVLAADSLRQMGYRNVFNIAGGLNACKTEEDAQ
jgi:phage shock protein E